MSFFVRIGRSLCICGLLCMAMSLLGQEAEQPAESCTKKKSCIKKMFSMEHDKNFRFYPIPLLSFSQQTSLEFGVTNVMMFRVGKKDKRHENLLSMANLLFHYTLNNQMTTGGGWRLYFGDMRLDGRLRYLSFPQQFFGVGSSTSISDEESYNIQSLSFSNRISWQVIPNLYVGPKYEFEFPFALQFEDQGQLASGEIEGSTGYLISGLGISLQYDNTNSSTFPTEGINVEFESMLMPPASRLGMNRAIGRHSLRIRRYQGWRDRHVLAMDVFLGMHSGTPPFTQMYMVGGEDVVRAYLPGRYRDRHLVYGQLEYRFQIYKRIWGNAYMGFAEVMNKMGEFSIGGMKPAVGGGLRYVIDKKEMISLRIDYARGKDGASGFYIGLNEVF